MFTLQSAVELNGHRCTVSAFFDRIIIGFLFGSGHLTTVELHGEHHVSNASV